MSGKQTQPAECPACSASRRRVVDAYFEGYLAGAVEMAAADIEHLQPLTYCAPHEIMAQQVILAMAQTLMQRKKG